MLATSMALLLCGGAAVSPSAAPASPAPASATSESPAGHWLVVLEVEGEGAARVLRVVQSQHVDAPLKRRRGPPQRLPWRVEAVDSQRRVLHEVMVADAQLLRLAAKNVHGKTDHHQTRAERGAFVVRLPELPTARRLVLRDAERVLGAVNVRLPEKSR